MRDVCLGSSWRHGSEAWFVLAKLGSTYECLDLCTGEVYDVDRLYFESKLCVEISLDA